VASYSIRSATGQTDVLAGCGGGRARRQILELGPLSVLEILRN